MNRTRILAALALVTAVLLAGCTPDETSSNKAKQQGATLPAATKLLEQAAQSVSEITSAHVTLRVTGDLDTLSVRKLEGDLTRASGSVEAKGTGKIRVMGQLVSIEFILTGGTLYIKGLTGGFQEIPTATSSTLPDPSAILDPDRGLAKLLRSIDSAETVGEQEVNGTPTYKVTGTVDSQALEALLPGISGSLQVSVWVAKDPGHRPIRAAVRLSDGEGKTSKVVITLSQVNEPVTVRPPS